MTREYSNAAQERALNVLRALAGHEVTGIAPGELSKGLGVSASNITRDLRVLHKMGFAEPHPRDPKRWRLGPKLVQIALAHKAHLESMRNDLVEVEQRYSRNPH